MSRMVAAIFCDDIREEVNGKQSFIGCYSGTLEVESFPATLPKLFVHCTVTTPMSDPFRKMELRIFKESHLLFSGAMPDTVFTAQDIENASDPSNVDRVWIFRMQVALAPLVLEESCSLRVRVVTEREELRGVGLRVLEIDDAPEVRGTLIES